MLHRTCQRNDDEVMNAARSEDSNEGEETIYLTFIVPLWYRSRSCFTVFLVLSAVEDVVPVAESRWSFASCHFKNN